MVLWGGHAPRFLCYQLDFLLDFFTEERSYQWLKDATSFGLLSDKSAEKLEMENSNSGHFSIGWVPHYGIMVRTCTSISLLSVGTFS